MPIQPEAKMTCSFSLALAFTSALLLGAASPANAARCESSLEQLVKQQDLKAIAKFKLAWEQGWSSEWVLKAARREDIDHFRPGLVLEWERRDGENKLVRLDAFTTDGCFYWAHETLFRSGRETARGPVYINQSGQPKYRAFVYLTGPDPEPSEDLKKLFDTSNILYYELEAIRDGQVQSVYRSNVNFGIDPYSLEPDRVPADAQLIRGTKWPAIERQLARAKGEPQ